MVGNSRHGAMNQQALTNAVAFYTVDQLFFGVTGTIDPFTWTMQPPIDRDPYNLVAIAGLPTPAYNVPAPLDVPADVRAAMLARNTPLPPFYNWLQLRPHIVQRFYPQFI